MIIAPKSRQRTWTVSLAGVTAFIVTASVAAQDTPRPDTSAWKCERCPFERGYTADFSLGATHVSDDSARFGNFTGYDEEGAYAFAEGSGRYTSDAYRLEWDLVDVGTDARAVTISGGQPGVYEYRVGYSELPYRRFDDTQTIFRQIGDETLALPAGWVGAGTTAGMAALPSSLVNQNIETDRTMYEVGAEYGGLDAFNFYASYRRADREGWGIQSASFYTSAAMFAAPLDDSTDTIDVAATYTQENWFVQLAWTGSFYDNSNTSWIVDNPFFAGAGAARAQIAQAPDNDAQVFTLSGAYHFPARTVLSASASMGEVQQDESLLPYSVDPALGGALPRASFDGQVDTTNYDLRIVSRPWDFLRMRALYRYDERDNQSSVSLWSRTIADIFPSTEPEANRPYSFERERLGVSATAHLDFWDWLDAFQFEAGYDRVETDRTLQEAPDQTEDMGYGEVRWRSGAGPELSLRAGASRREVDNYDLNLAALYEQNPLMRKYNLAYRFRDFLEFRGTAGFGDLPLTIGAQAYYASDDYSESPLGLRKADDRRFGADVTWNISERVSAYVQGAFEDIVLRTVNSESFNGADWSSEHQDEFTSVGAGVNVGNLLADRWRVRFDLTYAEGTGEVDVNSRLAGSGAWPELKTELLGATMDVDYRFNDALDLRLRLRYEDFSSSDWQLEGVEPGSLSQIVSLGADPYDYDVYLITLGVRYSFGRSPMASVTEEETSE